MFKVIIYGLVLSATIWPMLAVTGAGMFSWPILTQRLSNEHARIFIRPIWELGSGHTAEGMDASQMNISTLSLSDSPDTTCAWPLRR